MTFVADWSDVFWAKACPEALSGCWLWSASTTRTEYGRCHVKVGSSWHSRLAHRQAWTLAKGEPGPMHVLHRCDVRACVNPDHLFLGTHRDNMDDREAKGRNKPHPAPQGSAHHSAILTEARVAEARLRFAAGKSARSIGIEMGVRNRTMLDAIYGVTWRHVPGAVLRNEFEAQKEGRTR